MSTALHGMPDRLLTTEEVAEYLGVTPRWVSDQVRSRRVRCTRIGKHVRFTHEHVAELIVREEQPLGTEQVARRSGSRSQL